MYEKKRILALDVDMIIFDCIGVSGYMCRNISGEEIQMPFATLCDKLYNDPVVSPAVNIPELAKSQIRDDSGIWGNDKVNTFFKTVDYFSLPRTLYFLDAISGDWDCNLTTALSEADELIYISKLMPEATNTYTKTQAIEVLDEQISRIFPNIQQSHIKYTDSYGEKVKYLMDKYTADDAVHSVTFVDDCSKEFAIATDSKYNWCTDKKFKVLYPKRLLWGKNYVREMRGHIAPYLQHYQIPDDKLTSF